MPVDFSIHKMLAAIVVLTAVFFSTLVDAVGYSIITRKVNYSRHLGV